MISMIDVWMTQNYKSQHVELYFAASPEWCRTPCGKTKLELTRLTPYTRK